MGILEGTVPLEPEDLRAGPPSRADKKAGLWERDALDWYVEPIEATSALLRVEKFEGLIWDPACGQGNVLKAVVAANKNTPVGSDLVKRCDASWWRGPLDFLNFQENPVDLNGLAVAANIVTNPPFFRGKGTEAFIRTALALRARKVKVAVFTDIRFLAGHARSTGLFAQHPPSRIWVITPRVSCPPGSYLAAGNKAGNGSSDWCWLVWDSAACKGTEFGWLNTKARKDNG